MSQITEEMEDKVAIAEGALKDMLAERVQLCEELRQLELAVANQRRYVDDYREALRAARAVLG